jgi:hypothetical protein
MDAEPITHINHNRYSESGHRRADASQAGALGHGWSGRG